MTTCTPLQHICCGQEARHCIATTHCNSSNYHSVLDSVFTRKEFTMTSSVSNTPSSAASHCYTTHVEGVLLHDNRCDVSLVYIAPPLLTSEEEYHIYRRQQQKLPTTVAREELHNMSYATYYNIIAAPKFLSIFISVEISRYMVISEKQQLCYVSRELFPSYIMLATIYNCLS